MATATTAAPPVNEKGEFVRKPSSFRDWISKDPSSEFPAEKDRYHLYVSYACPWAHRTLVVLKLKGLEDAISFSTVHWLLVQPEGWRFTEEFPDPINGFDLLRKVYYQSDESYNERVTVPVLYDKKTKRIVNNESAEIIQMLNSEFNELAKNPSLDLYPEAKKAEIDAINEWLYSDINNGVYKCGFARSQAAYDEAFEKLFKSLDRVEELLSKSRFLFGNDVKDLTLADVRLWVTLVRFDPVYYGHFKTNLRRIADYPNLLGFTRDIYQLEGVKDVTNLYHIKQGYYQSMTNLNPTQIVPNGPELTYDAPHGRKERFSS